MIPESCFEEGQAFRTNAQTSPSRLNSDRLKERKVKRQPSITPRKFTRFFTPRSHGSLLSKSSRRALFDITMPSNNHSGAQSSPLRPTSNSLAGENSPTTFTREMKRRKLIHRPSLSPDNAECSKQSENGQSQNIGGHAAKADRSSRRSPSVVHGLETSEETSDAESQLHIKVQSQRIMRLKERGLSGELVELSLSYSKTRRYQHLSYPTSGK